MKINLSNWISDSDTIRMMEQFGVDEIHLYSSYQDNRKDDLYISLVSELFKSIRSEYKPSQDLARLGNSLAQIAETQNKKDANDIGINISETILFAASAFYFGGYAASAYVIFRDNQHKYEHDIYNACYELLSKSGTRSSKTVNRLLNSLRDGDIESLVMINREVDLQLEETFLKGPTEWIPMKLFDSMLKQFNETNIRAVLPNGYSTFWNPLVNIFLNQQPARFDFFPSQISAIKKGLLEREETFSLQMPTGAGKTTLCETLLYWHLKRNPLSVAIMLVPYRSLAAELKYSLVNRLNQMGISSRSAYGGTVPSGNESRSLEDVRALIATPETLSGMLTANPEFSQRISLVICDEGHLLDAPSRGVALELLLARLRIQEQTTPRFVFISAIVPNIEEINNWLGGTEETVVRSDYRPALAEFSVLSTRNSGSSSVNLVVHPHQKPPLRFEIEKFLSVDDFRFINPDTGRKKVYAYKSKKTLAIAAARKSLPLGGVVVFSANKRGRQGAIGLAEEALNQIDKSINLPLPSSYANRQEVSKLTEYYEHEYGSEWIGTKSIHEGIALHHGDIPQETRETIENALRNNAIRLTVCTNTLAEGVNLPIRTLVLYSVRRQRAEGKPEDLLIRDIKNLVGRAGRAGVTTKGLVICANENQWSLVEKVALQNEVEIVRGALRLLIINVENELARRSDLELSNQVLEDSPVVYSLIDGIDSTLMDLAATEIGMDTLRQIAMELADKTYAFQSLGESSKTILKNIIDSRIEKVIESKQSDRFTWIRETGVRLRMLEPVEKNLLLMRDTWDDINDATDEEFINIMLNWSWQQIDMRDAVVQAFRVNDDKVDTVKEVFVNASKTWLMGKTMKDIAESSGLEMDDWLGVFTQVISYTLQTLVEQGIALLERLLASEGKKLSTAVKEFPEFLRYGVSTKTGLSLATMGLRYRSAYVRLGTLDIDVGKTIIYEKKISEILIKFLKDNEDEWRSELGELVFERTLLDLSDHIK